MADHYTFETNSSEPCDICDGMEGEYDYTPVVPVHPHCECSVSEITDEPQYPADADDCELEVRDLEVWVDTYVESEEHTYENRRDDDATTEILVELGVEDANFDEGVEEALDWEPDYGDDSQSVELPAHSAGEINFQIQYTQMVCSGELWQVCLKEDEIAGVSESTETYVGPVGGMMIARTALLSAEVDGSDAEDGSTESDPYFHDDDEVPT